MINLSNLTKADSVTTVTPSNRIFQELGNNTYDYKDVISELIDNSIAKRLNDRILEVTIDLLTEESGVPVEFLIKDILAHDTADFCGLKTGR